MNALGRRLDHAVVALGAGAIVASAWAALPLPGTLNFIRSGIGGIFALLIAGVLAVLAGWRHLRLLALLAGALLVVTAVIQIATLAVGAAFGGDASLMAVCGGFGIGLLTVGAPRRPDDSADAESP